MYASRISHYYLARKKCIRVVTNTTQYFLISKTSFPTQKLKKPDMNQTLKMRKIFLRIIQEVSKVFWSFSIIHSQKRSYTWENLAFQQFFSQLISFQTPAAIWCDKRSNLQNSLKFISIMKASKLPINHRRIAVTMTV